MRARGSIIAGVVLLALAAALAGSSSAKHHAGASERSVGCSFLPDSGRVTLRLRSFNPFAELRGLPPSIEEMLGDFVVPGYASLERRADAVTVLAADPYYGDEFGGSAPRSCAGGDPSVFNTETVRARLGKHSSLGQLGIDLRYGGFEPGLTDEGDGTSEIEFEADKGVGVSVRMTRGADSATVVAGPSGAPAINLNPAEASADADVAMARGAAFALDGGGAADELTIATALPAKAPLFAAMLFGGQGDDTLRGASGAETFLVGFGSDRVAAGASPDVVIVESGKRHRIDCGGGNDALVSRAEVASVRGCEEQLGFGHLDSLFEDESFGEGVEVVSVQGALRLARALR